MIKKGSCQQIIIQQNNKNNKYNKKYNNTTDDIIIHCKENWSHCSYCLGARLIVAVTLADKKVVDLKIL